jgi:AAA family ATP:ADP antiporter
MSIARSGIHSALFRAIQVKPEEIRALTWSFLYFFVLLCAYYIVRPMRDEMGILGGVENLQWLFTGTLLAMTAAVPLFGWVSSRFPRRQFLPYVYFFFILCLVLFYSLMGGHVAEHVVARGFFIWASVFNLFVVSVFWSFMNDIFSNAQARRLFGVIAAGGTVGALTGPALTALLVQPLGARNLLLVSAVLLSVAIVCIMQLSKWSAKQPDTEGYVSAEIADKPMGGGIWHGIQLVVQSPYLIGICFLMLLFTSLATFLYFMQAQIVRDAFSDSTQRTALFATIDLSVNALTLLLQFFITSRLVKWLGVGMVLAIVPLLLATGFVALGIAPVLAVLIGVQVIRRAGNYAITRPAREMLYVVLGREEKYKAKNFIDTVVYRTGDAISAWLYAGLRSMGIGLSAIAFIAVPLALVWAWLGFGLGKQQAQLAITGASKGAKPREGKPTKEETT